MEAYSLLTLDIIGVFSLGLDLKNLSSQHSIFHECYHEIFDPPPAGLVLTAINAFVPIRWLPVKPNRDFIRANGIVHSMLDDIIKQRIAEVQREKEQSNSQKKASDEEESKDLLTFMVQEKYFADDSDRWSQGDMLDQILQFVAAGKCYLRTSDVRRRLTMKQDTRRRQARLSGHPTSCQPTQISRGNCWLK